MELPVYLFQRGLLFMARPSKNTVDYFPFICSEGETVYCIEQKYGNDGYATWVKILRQLAVTEYHYLNLSKHSSLMFLAAKCKIEVDKLNAIINDLVEFGDFDRELWEQSKVIYCEKFNLSIEDAYIKRNSILLLKPSLLQHLLSLGIHKPSLFHPKGSDNPQRKEKNIIIDNKKENTHDVEIYPTFKDFWHLYEKKVGHDITQKKWEKLTQTEKEKIIHHIPHYKKFQPNPKFRQNPATYLNQKTYNDDIQSIPENSSKQSTSKNGTWLDFAREVIHDTQANSGGEPPTQNS
jgi:hypothetical protein